MKTRTHRSNTTRGTALLVVMAIVLMAGIAGAGILAFASQQTYSMDRQRDIIQAKSIAEAGASKAFNELRRDFTVREDATAFPATAFGGGQFDVNITAVGPNQAVIESTGTFDDASIQVVMDVSKVIDGDDTPLDPLTNPYAHAVFSLGDYRVNGNGTLVGSAATGGDFRMNGSSAWTADIYAGSSATVIGGSSVVNGTVRSPSIGGSGAGGISNPVVGSVPVIPLPPLDLVYYYNIAQTNGQVTGGGNVPGAIGAIPGGVRWYNGNVTFSGAATWTGCIIATGSITFDDVNHTPLGELPAIVSRDSYLRFNGGTRNVTGLIWAAGDVRFNGNGGGGITGTIIAGGDVLVNGSWGNFTYKKSLPGGVDTTLNGVELITAWQK